MATSGNMQWAKTRATERAKSDNDAYSIYTHRNGDCIVRNAAAAPPDNQLWTLAATIQPDGSFSFQRSYTRIDAGTGREKPLDDSDWPKN
jgi:hypothetical protein